MKNLFNLNQLSMSWSGKQTPQRFGRYAVMLMMLLTLGVGQMWAASVSTGQMFFADINSCSNFKKDGIYVLFKFWNGESATEVQGTSAGTDLWYCTVPEGANGATKVSLQRCSSDFSGKYNETSKFDIETGKDVVKPSESDWSWTTATMYTSTTIYATPSTMSLTNWNASTKNFRANIKIGDTQFIQIRMSSTGKTYNGETIYKCQYFSTWGGFHLIQFQVYNGDSWDEQKVFDKTDPDPDWTYSGAQSNSANKIYNGSSWVAYACDQNVTVSSDANGSVDNEGTVLLYASGTSLTATPNSYYLFKDWTISGGGISPSSSSTNPQSFTATSDGGTIQANFRSQWQLLGSMTSPAWTENLAQVGTYTTAGGKTSGTVSMTLNANTNYSFKIKDVSGSGTWYAPSTNTDITYSNKATAQSMSSNAGGSPNQTITTAGKGTYTFTWNITDKTVTVTYPTSYIMTYGVWYKKASDGKYYSYPSAGSLGASGSVSGDIATGKYAANGETVTFTVGPNSGYSLLGWYSAVTSGTTTATAYVAGSGVSIGDGTLALSIGGAKNVYPILKEHVTTVTVQPNNSDRGTIAVNDVTPGGSSTTTTVGVSTTAKISATAAPGYHFVNWTLASGATLASGSLTDATIYVKGNGTDNSTGTATANFEPSWTVAGTMTDPTWKWDATSNVLTNYETVETKNFGYATISLAANTTYTLKVKDRTQDENNGWYGIASGSTATYAYANDNTYKAVTTAYGNQDIALTTAAGGDYQFKWNLTDKQLAIDFPTSYLITSGVKTVYDPNISKTSDATETGGTYTAVDNSSNNVKGANKYVASGASVTFTATPEDGYAFKGWYSDAACSTKYYDNSSTENTIVINDAANTLTLNSITADKAVYAKFEEIMTRIYIHSYGGKFSIDAGSAISENESPYLQVGVKTKHTVAIASEDEGYYFSNWDLSAANDEEINFSISDDKDDEDNRTITVTGLGRDGSSLNFIAPTFKVLDKIYFRNIFDEGGGSVWYWDNVYAYFDVSWSDGEHRAITSNADEYSQLHVQMTEIGSSHIYSAYVPRYATRNSKTKVAFASINMTERNHSFWAGEGSHANGVYRTDYNKKHNMFVPNHTKSQDDAYTFSYFNNGYWAHYGGVGADAGYWIVRHTGSKTYTADEVDRFVIIEGAYGGTPKIQYSLRIDGPAKNQYLIKSAGGLKYGAASTITTSACDNINLNEVSGDDAYFTLTPTAEGEYVITIDQSSDVMKISVNYPISVNDYVIENTYTGRNKANTLDSTYVTRSNVIKYAVAQDSARYSMYIGTADGTLKLYQCTAINGSGVATWTEREDRTDEGSELAKIWTKVNSKPGVYQFDLKIDKSNAAEDNTSKVNRVYEDSVRLYDGNFYLKTDAADGGWISYKQNKMDKNTVNFDRTSATFDNYWCKYFATNDCNIKCVIANDYCNQVSDTMKADGIARMVGKEPYVPIDGTSIRFSYNSATNTIGRAYLGASTNKDYLNVKPNTSGYVYVEHNSSDVDLHGLTGDDLWRSWFKDNGDFVYEINTKVYPGAKAGVQATYNTTYVQTLLPTTHTVLGGTKGVTTYDVRMVYDFKTNYLMASFILPEGEITEALSDVDMLWVRHKDESATQVNIGTGGSLSNVRVIGAIEFRYDEMCWNAASPVDLSSWGPLSRPYLKYFVSFPFDVELTSIFGLNQPYYGLDYVIQKYDGAKRAEDGLFAGDGDNYWVNMKMGETMKANEGYCVILDNDYARWNGSSDMWYNKSEGSSVFLYFPAKERITSISNSEKTSTVEAHKCNIDRFWSNNSKKNHINTDSHWNMIGSPLFHDSYIKDTLGSDTFQLRSFYYLDMADDNKWKAKAVAEDRLFKAMHSKFVQWCGTLNWTTTVTAEWGTYSASAPRRATAEDQKSYFMKLELTYNDKVSDWTYVEMCDDADTAFVLREDMCKYTNTGIPQIYTFAGGYDVAYNTTTIETQTIPVGVIIRKNGTYTFSMPTNFSGEVTLIDTYAQTRTNLALEDYEVELPKGTIDDRFLLEFKITNSPTAIDGAIDGSGSLKDGKAHKFIMNDQMYILNDGVIYDARGNRVK